MTDISSSPQHAQIIAHIAPPTGEKPSEAGETIRIVLERAAPDVRSRLSQQAQKHPTAAALILTGTLEHTPGYPLASLATELGSIPIRFPPESIPTGTDARTITLHIPTERLVLPPPSTATPNTATPNTTAPSNQPPLGTPATTITITPTPELSALSQHTLSDTLYSEAAKLTAKLSTTLTHEEPALPTQHTPQPQTPPFQALTHTQLSTHATPPHTSSPLISSHTPTPPQTQPITESLQALPPVPADTPAWPIWAPIIFQPGHWPALSDIHHTLTQHATAHTANTALSQIPSPQSSAALLPGMLLFASLIKTGDPGQWLNTDTLALLKKLGKDRPLTALSQEGNALQRLSTETGQDWRSFALPLHHEGHIEKLILHSKTKDPTPEDSNDSTDTTRFILDFTLRSLGPLQLEGLFRPGHLDIAIKTHRQLPTPMKADLDTLYNKALDAASLSGSLTIHTNTAHWFTLDAPQHTSLSTQA